MFTDALTLQMYCKDEDVLDHEKKWSRAAETSFLVVKSLWRTQRVSAFLHFRTFGLIY